MILVCVYQFWIVHHRIFSGTSSRSSGSFLLTERRSGKASRKGATFPSRHNAQSMPYGGSPAFFASDNKLDFCSLFYTICIFASSRSSDIIGISFCHSKGGESMYRRVFPVIDPVATGKNIVRLRQARGMTVKDLQQWFGFEEPRAIYKWQQGQTLPSVDNLIALSALLEVPVEDILVCRHSQSNSPISLGRQDHSCRPLFLFPVVWKTAAHNKSFRHFASLLREVTANCVLPTKRSYSLAKNFQRFSRPSHVSLHMMEM